MRQDGFTLLELMLVVAIVGITLVFGAPSLDYTLDSGRLTANTNEFVGALNLARLEAVKQGRTVRISSISGGGDWGAGFRLWIDANANDLYNAGEEIRIYPAIDNGLTLIGDGGASSISFLASGFTSQATGNNVTLKLCSDNSSLTDRQVVINTAGRITVGDTGADC